MEKKNVTTEHHLASEIVDFLVGNDIMEPTAKYTFDAAKVMLETRLVNMVNTHFCDNCDEKQDCDNCERIDLENYEPQHNEGHE